MGVWVWWEHRTDHRPSWLRSVPILGLLPRWVPAILVCSPQGLGTASFLPSAHTGGQAPPISFLLSSNVTVSMKPVLSTVFNDSAPPNSLFPFWGASHQLKGWLVRLLVTLRPLQQRELHKDNL